MPKQRWKDFREPGKTFHGITPKKKEKNKLVSFLSLLLFKFLSLFCYVVLWEPIKVCSLDHHYKLLGFSWATSWILGMKIVKWVQVTVPSLCWQLESSEWGLWTPLPGKLYTCTFSTGLLVCYVFLLHFSFMLISQFFFLKILTVNTSKIQKNTEHNRYAFSHSPYVRNVEPATYQLYIMFLRSWGL